MASNSASAGLGDYENLSEISRLANREARSTSDEESSRHLATQTPASSSSSYPGVVMRRPTTGSEDDEHTEMVPQVGTTFYDYQAKEKDELSFQRGSVVEIIEKDREKGWVYGKIDNKTGMVPENYVRLIGRQPKEIRACDFEKIEEKVGNGASSNVYRGLYKGQMVALKIPRFNKGENQSKKIESLKREALVYARLNHKNIVAFYGICIESPCLLLELCEGGTLMRLYRELSFAVFSTVIKWGLQVAEGMNHLHNRDDALLHADLKADNILVKEVPCLCEHNERSTDPPTYHNNICTNCNGTKLDKLTLKITDFGLSRDVTSSRASFGGSCAWMSPELIARQEFSKASDIWSFGILFWEILTNHMPLQEYEGAIVVIAIAQRGKTPDIPDNCPLAIRNVMQLCWQQNPERRPSFTEVIVLLKQALKEVDKSKGWNTEDIMKKSRARTDVSLKEVEEEIKKRGIDPSKYSTIPFNPKPPKTAERSIKRKPRPIPKIKGKVSKENIGGPQDFQHMFHVIATSTSPDSRRFDFFENPDKDVHPSRHHRGGHLERQESVDAQTLPRSYKHSVKEPKTVKRPMGNEHLHPMGFNRNASKSNPELFGAFSINKQHIPRRSNAYRHKDFERIHPKIKTTNSSDSSEDNVIISAEDVDIREPRHTDYDISQQSSRKSNAIFYDLPDSDSSISAVSDTRQKPSLKTKFFNFNFLKKRPSPTRVDQLVDRPCLPQCFHPNHSNDLAKNFSHQCGLQEPESPETILGLEPELHLLSKFARLHHQQAQNHGRPFIKMANDPDKRRRPQPPTPVQRPGSTVSSKVLKARQNLSISETEGSFDQGFDEEDFNSSMNSNYQTPLSSHSTGNGNINTGGRTDIINSDWSKNRSESFGQPSDNYQFAHRAEFSLPPSTKDSSSHRARDNSLHSARDSSLHGADNYQFAHRVNEPIRHRDNVPNSARDVSGHRTHSHDHFHKLEFSENGRDGSLHRAEFSLPRSARDGSLHRANASLPPMQRAPDYQMPLHRANQSYPTTNQMKQYEAPLYSDSISDELDIDIEEIKKAASSPFTNQTYQPMKDSIYGAEKLQRPSTLAVHGIPHNSLSSPSRLDDEPPVIEIAECQAGELAQGKMSDTHVRMSSDSHLEMSPELMPKGRRSMSDHQNEVMSPKLPPRPTHLSPSVPNLPISPGRSRNSSNCSLTGDGHRRHRQRHSVLDQYIEVPDGRRQSPTTHVPFLESPKVAEEFKEPLNYFMLNNTSDKDSPPTEPAPPPPTASHRVPKIPVRLNKTPKSPPTFM
ncbi:unnamed protein product [Bursaphelenchus okinawaensis]|uniref:mitogen-activated protein kinase kinase kinase n=1 Tax=Bursaphelenchus okinawaensis TaxID=465554 RepID=A0A811KNK8_9BILA|nr:unnamed protein product [Bursaphelenchus okinawaensis]CAG9107432.1 unnamed protein product [Bursaphelenchus okinawaensis]